MAAGALRGYGLKVGPPDALAVSVVRFLPATVLSQLRAPGCGRLNGGPGWLAAPVDRALRPTARFAARSLVARKTSFMPDCSRPIPFLADVPVAGQAARLRDLGADVLSGELAADVRISCRTGRPWRVSPGGGWLGWPTPHSTRGRSCSHGGRGPGCCWTVR